MHIEQRVILNTKEPTNLETDLTTCLFNQWNENIEDFSLSLETAATKIQKEQQKIDTDEESVITTMLISPVPIQIIVDTKALVFAEPDFDKKIEIYQDAMTAPEQDSTEENGSSFNLSSKIMHDLLSTTTAFKTSETKTTPPLQNDRDLIQKYLPLMNAFYQNKPNDIPLQTTDSNEEIEPLLTQPEALKHPAETISFKAAQQSFDKPFLAEQEKKLLPTIHSENTNSEEIALNSFKLNPEQKQFSMPHPSFNQDFNATKTPPLQTAGSQHSPVQTTDTLAIETENVDKNLSGNITLHFNNDQNIGNITAKIQMINKESVVTFITETSETKQLLLNHVAHLKEIFNESNISLGQTHIEQQNQQQKQDRSHQQHHTPEFFDVETLINKEKSTNALQQTNKSIHSLLDTFA